MSCPVRQLVEAIHGWALNTDKKCQTNVLFIDFSKTFNKVAHCKLLHKIDHYSIRGKTKGWIEGFLSGCSQEVSVCGMSSHLTDLLSGDPQGSVLELALFLLHVNDTTEEMHSTVRLFTDDSEIYSCAPTKNYQELLHEDLQRVFEWAQ